MSVTARDYEETTSRRSWPATWRAVARVIAWRGDCELAQVGAVIVTPANRIVAVGYNGPAAQATTRCVDCPRRTGERGTDYAACASIHAEANALLVCDRRDREGGTMYVSSAMCLSCAKLVANSGLATVYMDVDWAADAHREPMKVADYLGSCGVKVLMFP